MKSLSVVIPAYNEEKRIGKTLLGIRNYLDSKKLDYEIIVVNDCSKDNTAKVVKKYARKHVKLLSNPKNKGKGYTVKKGMMAAKKEWVLFSDADLSTPIQMLEKMLPYTKKYDIIIGSRNVKESNIVVKQPWYRVMAGKAFPLVVQVLLLRGIKDTQCGFKLFRKKTILPVFGKQKLEGWAFDAELLFIAKKKGHKIKEVGITWKNDDESKLSLVKDSMKMFKDIIKIRINHLKGEY